MTIFRRCGAFLLGLILTISVSACAKPLANIENNFHAVWVSTVFNLDYPSKATADAAALKKQAVSILDSCKEMGLNAVMLQVRPSADAIYPSALFPWSVYLTGDQKTAPSGGFDPLEYWVKEAHKRGIALHAWLNPYRITKKQDAEFAALSDKSPAKQHPDWVICHSDGNYYFDPGLPETRKLVIDGALELVKNYDIDGIHMDDYFYPDPSFPDNSTYQRLGNGLSLEDWRRENVNTLIRELGEAVKAEKPDIAYGISPAGIWANKKSMPEGSDTTGGETYFSHFADTKKWVEEEWIDYICPQIYWYIGQTGSDYQILVDWWANVVRPTKVKLYIGMADYKAAEAKEGEPWHGTDALKAQMDYNRTKPEVKGEIHFRFGSIGQVQGLNEYYKQSYTLPQPSVPPLENLDHMAYLRGDGGMIFPDGALTRAQAATVFARLSRDKAQPFDENGSYPSLLTDIMPDAWYASAVGYMEKQGIINGYEDGTFRPDATVTRAEFAFMAAKFKELQPGSGASFSDVPSNHWAYGAIAAGVERGYLSGYGEGQFRPDNHMTRAEMAKVINRLLERIPDKDCINVNSGVWGFQDLSSTHWAYYELLEAAVSHNVKKTDEQEWWSFE